MAQNQSVFSYSLPEVIIVSAILIGLNVAGFFFVNGKRDEQARTVEKTSPSPSLNSNILVDNLNANFSPNTNVTELQTNTTLNANISSVNSAANNSSSNTAILPNTYPSQSPSVTPTPTPTVSLKPNPKNVLVGTWRAVVDEPNFSGAILWRINSDGTTSYLFIDSNPPDTEIEGRWSFANDRISETTSSGYKGSSVVKVVNEDYFILTTDPNENNEGSRLTRHYHRVYNANQDPNR